jgi:hypothetical protein
MECAGSRDRPSEPLRKSTGLHVPLSLDRDASNRAISSQQVSYRATVSIVGRSMRGPSATIVITTGTARSQPEPGDEPYPARSRDRAAIPRVHCRRIVTDTLRRRPGHQPRLIESLHSRIPSAFGIVMLSGRRVCVFPDRRCQHHDLPRYAVFRAREVAMRAALLTGFSVLALLMAALGFYALIQYSIATRRKSACARPSVHRPATSSA